MKWLPWNFAHDKTAVLSCHVQIVMMISYPTMDLHWNQISIEFEYNAKIIHDMVLRWRWIYSWFTEPTPLQVKNCSGINLFCFEAVFTNVSLFADHAGYHVIGCKWTQSHQPLRATFIGPTWGPSGANRTQVGPMLALWILLSGTVSLWGNEPECNMETDGLLTCLWHNLKTFCNVISAFCNTCMFLLTLTTVKRAWCLLMSGPELPFCKNVWKIKNTSFFYKVFMKS